MLINGFPVLCFAKSRALHNVLDFDFDFSLLSDRYDRTCSLRFTVVDADFVASIVAGRCIAVVVRMCW